MQFVNRFPVTGAMIGLTTNHAVPFEPVDLQRFQRDRFSTAFGSWFIDIVKT